MLTYKFSIEKKITFIIGHLKYFKGPFIPFDKQILSFFNILSKEIFEDKNAKKYPDLIAFAFWCRISNILKISKKYDLYKRFGRGTILHIPPSNVPTNFAYSLIFGMLSGNNNLVRLPEKNFEQVNIFIKILKKLKKKGKFKNIFKKFALIKYPNSNEISEHLSKFVEGRVIWGSDNTIKQFKKFETLPRCVDLFFPNRFSVAIIDSRSYENLSPRNKQGLIEKFYIDCYTMNQYGCSSPNIIFWKGKYKKKIIDQFWEALNRIVTKKNKFKIQNTNSKLTNLFNEVLVNQSKININLKNFKTLKTKIPKTNYINNNIKFGFFYETNFTKFHKIKKYFTIDLQTLAYFGISESEIRKFIITNKIKGVDRIIPIGRAFDIGVEWDGYDIVSNLSRVIAD